VSDERSQRLEHVRVIGVGNLLRSDDGLGVHVIREAEKLSWPSSVELLDAGTGGPDIVHLLTGVSHVCLVDAMRMGRPPGTIYRFPREAARLAEAAGEISMHGFGLATALRLGEALGIRPEVLLVGVEPLSLEYGKRLTATVQAQVQPVLAIIRETVAAWTACDPSAGRSGGHTGVE